MRIVLLVVLMTNLLVGGGDPPSPLSSEVVQTIPVPSRWEGRATKFLEGEKVVVEFQVDGEMNIRWQSVGINFVEPRIYPVGNSLRLELGEHATGTCSFLGDRLTMRIANLRIGVETRRGWVDASRTGITIVLRRAKR